MYPTNKSLEIEPKDIKILVTAHKLLKDIALNMYMMDLEYSEEYAVIVKTVTQTKNCLNALGIYPDEYER